MKNFNMYLLLMSCVFLTNICLADSDKSLSTEQRTKRTQIRATIETPKSYTKLAIFLASALFLIYLPKHLSSNLNSNDLDKLIKWPHERVFTKILTGSEWGRHLYYEVLTLLAGYGIFKTAPDFKKHVRSLDVLKEELKKLAA